MRLTTATASPIRASVMLARSALVAMFLAFGVLAISDSFANDPRAEQARAEQQLAALQKRNPTTTTSH